MNMYNEPDELASLAPNENARSMARKLGHAFGSNLLALAVSLIVTLLLPKLLGITDYGFWQLYVFYVGYVGVLQFGWSDGIYLRLGGKQYASLNRVPPLFAILEHGGHAGDPDTFHWGAGIRDGPGGALAYSLGWPYPRQLRFSP